MYITHFISLNLKIHCTLVYSYRCYWLV